MLCLFFWCEALSSIFASWRTLRAVLGALNFRVISASNLQILWGQQYGKQNFRAVHGRGSCTGHFWSLHAWRLPIYSIDSQINILHRHDNFFSNFWNHATCIWEALRASELQFSSSKFHHYYMVRSTLLHLCILAGPSGWSGAFEFSCNLCIKSANPVRPAIRKTRFPSSAW